MMENKRVQEQESRVLFSRAGATISTKEITIITISPNSTCPYSNITRWTVKIKMISERLCMPKDQINLLFHEKHLTDGTKDDNRLQQGSCLTLLPKIETSLQSQPPEQHKLQVFKNLNDAQVYDFLSGREPLNVKCINNDHSFDLQIQYVADSSEDYSNNDDASYNDGCDNDLEFTDISEKIVVTSYDSIHSLKISGLLIKPRRIYSRKNSPQIAIQMISNPNAFRKRQWTTEVDS